jgi:hypothetical protein
MLSFVLLGGGLTLYILWGLTAYPLQVSAHGHSIVYFNPVTTTTAVAVLYVIATCDALLLQGSAILSRWALPTSSACLQ